MTARTSRTLADSTTSPCASHTTRCTTVSASPKRDRILDDLAGSFYMLGVKSAARDAFLILAATGA